MRDYRFREWYKCNDGSYKMSEPKTLAEVNSDDFTDGYEVMQSIGLLDKEGVVESFESDICQYEYAVYLSQDPEDAPKITQGIGIIVYIDGCFMIEDVKTKGKIPLHYADLSFKKIGNIHSNPELMGGE